MAKSNLSIRLVLFLIILASITTNSSYAVNSSLNNSEIMENDSGCCSVIVNVKPGDDVISYRRDSGYSANIIVENVNFTGQNAIKQYKTKKGYFTHVIITEDGWIIGIGGRDNPIITIILEKIGSNIISKGKIEKPDIDKANEVIKHNGWGHFLIKSPNDDIGVTAYDSRVSKSLNKIFKMKDGDYVKIPNNPRYYNYGQYNTISKDPSDAALKIAGKDAYGQDRKDILTYSYDNHSFKEVNVWASFDGGALFGHTKGKPDNIQFVGNKTNGNQLPIIPSKKYLGEIRLHPDFNQSKELMSPILHNSFMNFMMLNTIHLN